MEVESEAVTRIAQDEAAATGQSTAPQVQESGDGPPQRVRFCAS